MAKSLTRQKPGWVTGRETDGVPSREVLSTRFQKRNKIVTTRAGLSRPKIQRADLFLFWKRVKAECNASTRYVRGGSTRTPKVARATKSASPGPDYTQTDAFRQT